jgi:prepilin-type N-terminal cleavage/methylation domain-containing protein
MNRRKEQGFTIIELLIVIIVVGVLAVVVIFAYAGIKQKDRNNERHDDITVLHAQVESYFAQTGKYPTLANMNDATWRKANMKGFDADWLKDPSGTSGALVAKPTADAYSYQVSASDGSDCNNNGKDCVKYVLTTEYEGGGTFTETNLN